MGGAAGHLQHLYENLGLTFGEIKEVLSSAAEGRLEKTTEKLDGMNLVFTWADDQLKVARSGSEIKGGGLDAAGLAKRFFGRGNVEEAFNTAFKVLQQALGTLGPKEQSQVFKDGRRWYSMEVIYAKDPNTINYDSNNIVFHGWPIYDVGPDGVKQTKDDSGVTVLTKRIDQMQRAVTQRDWQVRGPSLLRLQKLGDGSILQKAIRQIDGAMSAGGVDDGDTVYDYLRNLFADDAKGLKLPPKVYKMVVERCATGAPGVPEIKKETPKELHSTVQTYVKASDALKDKWMAPIEDAIHFFAIEVLRGLHSTLIAKNDDEVDRLRSQLGRAIRTIEKSGHTKAMEVLQSEMSRLGNVENLAAAMEGIVFFFKGQAYKFTGAFAPAHQIMALFKYGRKDIPKMDLGERQLKEALDKLLEGGGSFHDVEPISLEDFEHVWPVLEADLEMLGCTDIHPIGSTGKKPIMGDVDVAAQCAGGAAALFDAAVQVFGKDSVKKVGGSVVAIRYLQDVPAFQVDVMVGDPKYVQWGRAGAASIKGHPDYSPVKGVGRNILLNVINRWVTQAVLPGKQTELDRERYVIDFDRGLFHVIQTKQNKDPKKPPNKNWRDVDRKLISDDPDQIVELMFGKGTKANDLKSFDGVVRALRQSPKLKQHAEEILKTFADEMHGLVSQTPDMLGDSPEEVLGYIDRVALGEGREAAYMLLNEIELQTKDLKKRPERMDTILRKIRNKEMFQLSGAGGSLADEAGSAKIEPTPELISALETHDVDAVNAALSKVTWITDFGEVKHGGLSITKLEKTSKDFGGGKSKKDTAAVLNESSVEAVITAAIKKAGHPVLVAFGKYELPAAVVAAKHVGGAGRLSDVALQLDDGTEFNVSIKGDYRSAGKKSEADFYLSGDRAAAPWMGPVIDALVAGKAPAPRLQHMDAGMFKGQWNVVVGPDDSYQPVNVTFPIPDDFAQVAAFDRGEGNRVDIIVFGDLTVPTIEDYLITWPGGSWSPRILARSRPTRSPSGSCKSRTVVTCKT